MDERDYEILMAMEAYGGGFVSRLAELAFKADATNYQMIRSTWAHYFDEYGKIVDQKTAADKARAAARGGQQ